MEELKPCPFCGGEWKIDHWGANQWYGHCTCCNKYTAPYANYQDAVDAVNRRTAPETLTAPQEAEALDIMESLLDVADMKCTGPLYADDPPRNGLCRIPEDDATKLRQYIAHRRAAPENKPLTLEQLRQMDESADVEIRPLKPRLWHAYKDSISTNCFETYRYEDYGKTWLAYDRRPE